MYHWYKFTCPVCSGVIDGPADLLQGANEEHRSYEVISEGDARLCRWDDIPQTLLFQIVQHRHNYDMQVKTKQHPALMLNPDVTQMNNPTHMKEIVKEGSSLVIRSTSQKSLDQCPVTAVHLLIMSYMTTRWSPPSSKFSANEILRVKNHLSFWGAVRNRQVRNGKARQLKSELRAILDLVKEEIHTVDLQEMYLEPDKNDRNTQYSLRDREDLAFMESAILQIIVSVSDSLDRNENSTIFSNGFKPDEFVRFMINSLSTAVKKVLPCPLEETTDYYECQVEFFAVMVASHLKCIAQCKATN